MVPRASAPCSARSRSTGPAALHHVLGQTFVRACGTPHAETYAALLPETIEAMRARAPEPIAALAAAIGAEPDDISARIRRLAGDRRLAELGADRRCIAAVVEGAMARPELARMTPGEVERSDLVAIIEAAWWHPKARSACNWPARRCSLTRHGRGETLTYHRFTREHGVNWPLYFLARLILVPSSSTSGLADRPRARWSPGR